MVWINIFLDWIRFIKFDLYILFKIHNNISLFPKKFPFDLDNIMVSHLQQWFHISHKAWELLYYSHQFEIFLNTKIGTTPKTIFNKCREIYENSCRICVQNFTKMRSIPKKIRLVENMLLPFGRKLNVMTRCVSLKVIF